MKDTRLPDWFDGKIYEKGDTVRNPFSGEEFELDSIELSMYDFIVGAQMVIQMGMDKKEIMDDLKKALDWFRKNNSEAYMVLLD